MKSCFAALLILSFATFLLAQEEREPVSVPEEEMQRLLIHRVDPVLPPQAGVGLQGTVVLRAVISKSGTVESLQVVSGHPMLVPAALDAVRRWKYRHYEVNGIPVRVGTIVRAGFSEANEDGEASSGKTESPILVTADDMRDRLVYRVAPLYPPLARQARIQGSVMLRIVINPMGEVRETQVVSGHPMLARAAVDAVNKWRYLPYESEGKAAEVQTEVQIIFTLAGT